MDFIVGLFAELFAPFLSEQAGAVYEMIFLTLPLWLPLGAALLLWEKWIEYIRAKFFATEGAVLLEIRLPQEMVRSPAAMELVLAGLYYPGGEGNWYDRYIKGKTRPWFTLEIASLEGHIHFFVWGRKGMKNFMESRFYAQYPGIEILEVADYTDFAPYYDPERIGVHGLGFKLTKQDSYPIKTYIDYGLDKDPKEEYKYDPLVILLEHMGSIGKGEQMWFQVVFRSHKMRKKTSFPLVTKTTWKEETEELIQTLAKKYRGEDEKNKKDDERPRIRFPLKTETDILEGLHRSMSKLAFDCGVRMLYVAETGAFERTRIPGVMNAMRPFESGIFNSFGVDGKMLTSFDFPWQDFMQIRIQARRRKIIDAYRRRSYFYPPHDRPAFVLTSEELATIFHFPGQIAQVPLLSRLPSRKAEPPPNLPV